MKKRCKFFYLIVFFMISSFCSCHQDNTPVTSITDMLKINAYVYDENGETFRSEQLRLNETELLVPISVLQESDDTSMVNFNLHFEYEDGICHSFLTVMWGASIKENL